MKNTSSPVRLTYQDLLALPEDRLRHELIDGEHLVTPAPNSKHQRVSLNLSWLLRAYLEEHPLGEAFPAPFDVWFSDFDVVEPDLLYVSRERLLRQLTEKNLAGAPDLVIEVLSQSTRRRDAGVKLRLYERQGVTEYWLIDPEDETIAVYRLAEGSFQLQQRLSRTGTEGSTAPILSTSLLPGLRIPLDKVFDPVVKP